MKCYDCDILKGDQDALRRHFCPWTLKDISDDSEPEKNCPVGKMLSRLPGDTYNIKGKKG